jgi:SPP1 family phage portal protein
MRTWVQQSKNKVNIYIFIVTDEPNSQQRSREYQKKLDRVFRRNDFSALHAENAENYAVMGSAINYVFEDSENQLIVTELDPKTSVVYYDYSTPPKYVACVRTWGEVDEDDDIVEVIEIITNTYRRKYSVEGDILQLAEQQLEEVLNWDDQVPVFEIKQRHGLALSEAGFTLIDALENILSGLNFAEHYNTRNTKLVTIGYEPPTDEAERLRVEDNLRMSTLIALDGATEVKWLVREINHAGTLAAVKMLLDLYAALVGTSFNIHSDFNNIVSAEAMKFHSGGVESPSAKFSREAKKGYERMCKLLTHRINHIERTEYDYLDLDISIPRNIPTDTHKDINTMVAARNSGLVSHKSAIGKSNLELNALEEFANLSEEKIAITDRHGIQSLISLLDRGILSKEDVIERILVPNEVTTRAMARILSGETVEQDVPVEEVRMEYDNNMDESVEEISVE